MPADYDDSAAGELELAVAIFRQSNEGESGTPLVYLDGGPGGNALKPIPFVFDQGLAALAEGRDLIVFDQRGVGYSNPALDCPEFTDLTFDLLNRIIADTEAFGPLAECDSGVPRPPGRGGHRSLAVRFSRQCRRR